MALAKLTSVRGKPDPSAVVVSAGAAEAQTDTISLNVDFTKMTRGDVLLQLETIRQRIFAAAKWPLI